MLLSQKAPPRYNLSIGVEYDCRGRRKLRVFSDCYVARRFYVVKFGLGKNPVVVRVERG